MNHATFLRVSLILATLMAIGGNYMSYRKFQRASNCETCPQWQAKVFSPKEEKFLSIESTVVFDNIPTDGSPDGEAGTICSPSVGDTVEIIKYNGVYYVGKK